MHDRGSPRPLRRITAVLALAVTTALAVGGGVASAVVPVPVAGNPTCATLLPASAFLTEVKRDPATSTAVGSPLTVTAGGATGQLAIVVRSTPLGQVADFTMTGGLRVVAVFVKASDGGHLYDYRPAGSAGDTGLHGPVAPGGVYHDISHISFCVDKPKPQQPPDEEEPPPDEEEPPKPPVDPPALPPVITTFTPPLPPAPPPVVASAPSITRPAAPRPPRVIVPGSARLRAPDGCRSTTFRVRVSGRQIRRVTFSLDGRQVRTFRRQASTYSVRIDPRRLTPGVHRISVRVVFTTASGTRARTLRSVFQRCLQGRIGPRFTG
jgi:hypothetical protein